MTMFSWRWEVFILLLNFFLCSLLLYRCGRKLIFIQHFSIFRRDIFFPILSLTSISFRWYFQCLVVTLLVFRIWSLSSTIFDLWISWLWNFSTPRVFDLTWWKRLFIYCFLLILCDFFILNFFLELIINGTFLFSINHNPIFIYCSIIVIKIKCSWVEHSSYWWCSNLPRFPFILIILWFQSAILLLCLSLTWRKRVWAKLWFRLVSFISLRI